MRKTLFTIAICILLPCQFLNAQGGPPVANNICEAAANTGGLGCVTMLDGQDSCPGNPSSPCMILGVTCEYNPLVGIEQCWFSQDSNWRLRGFEMAGDQNIKVNRYKAAEEGENGHTIVPSNVWQRKVCERRFVCECEYDFQTGYSTCKSKPCGELYILNIVKAANMACIGEEGGSGGGPGEGGPGGQN